MVGALGLFVPKFPPPQPYWWLSTAVTTGWECRPCTNASGDTC